MCLCTFSSSTMKRWWRSFYHVIRQWFCLLMSQLFRLFNKDDAATITSSTIGKKETKYFLALPKTMKPKPANASQMRLFITTHRVFTYEIKLGSGHNEFHSSFQFSSLLLLHSNILENRKQNENGSIKKKAIGFTQVCKQYATTTSKRVRQSEI